MGFSRQEYWSGLPFPSPGDLPDTGIEPGFPTLQTDSLSSEPQGSPLIKVICKRLVGPPKSLDKMFSRHLESAVSSLS